MSDAMPQFPPQLIRDMRNVLDQYGDQSNSGGYIVKFDSVASPFLELVDDFVLQTMGGGLCRRRKR